MRKRKKNKEKISLLGRIRKHLDLILDVLYYVSFLGILCSVITITWGDFFIGIRLLVTFLLIMGFVIYAAFKTADQEEKDTAADNDRSN